MLDTRPVDFVLQLPAVLAESAEEIRRRDPEYLSSVIRYGLVRRVIYEELDRATGARRCPSNDLSPSC
jgi:hypothetical protein